MWSTHLRSCSPADPGFLTVWSSVAFVNLVSRTLSPFSIEACYCFTPSFITLNVFSLTPSLLPPEGMLQSPMT